MITGAELLRCGNCGGGTFRVYQFIQNGERVIATECTGCVHKGVTIITTERPRLRFEWGKESEGVIAS